MPRPVTHLRQLQAEKSIFVQSTSLERIWDRAVEAIKRLVDYAKSQWGSDVVIVNTDGWIAGEEAVAYKRSLLSALAPTGIVAIRIGGELDEIVKGFTNVAFARPPPAARTRSKEDRKIHRDMSYGRFIFPVKEISIDLDKLPFCNLVLSKGIIIDNNLMGILSRAINSRIFYAVQSGNLVYAITEGWAIKRVGNVRVFGLPEGFERGLLVGFEDSGGFLLGLGVLKRIYYEKRKAVIYASAKLERSLDKARCIRVGYVRLNENFEEAEKVTQLLRYDLYSSERDGSVRGAGSA